MAVLRTASTLTAAAVAAGVLAVVPHATAGGTASVEHDAAAKKVRHIAFDRWRAAALRAGVVAGAKVRRGSVVLGARTVRTRYNDPYDHAGARAYDRGSWRSPWTPTHFGLTELIASY